MTTSKLRALSTAFVAIAALVAATTPASAGKQWKAEVKVSPGYWGLGALGDARNSADSEQVIGCQIWGYAGAPAEMYCFAADKSGETVGCYSKDPALVAIAATVSGDSYVEFYVDGEGSCSALTVWNVSELAPKQ